MGHGNGMGHSMGHAYVHAYVRAHVHAHIYAYAQVLRSSSEAMSCTQARKSRQVRGWCSWLASADGAWILCRKVQPLGGQAHWLKLAAEPHGVSTRNE